MYLVVVFIIVFLDITPMFMSDDVEKLLYTDQEDSILEETQSQEMEASPFGTSTVDGTVNETDISDSEAKKRAEELLNEIYNGGSDTL